MGTIKNEKLVKSPTFEVKDNVLWFDDYFLQLSNISQVQALEVEALPYKYPLFFACAGIVILILKQVFLGITLLVVAGVLFYMIYHYKQNPKYNLFITLNSGHTFRFACKDKAFAVRVMQALRNCITFPQANIYVDFSKNSIMNISKSKIDNSNIIQGNNNTVAKGTR